MGNFKRDMEEKIEIALCGLFADKHFLIKCLGSG